MRKIAVITGIRADYGILFPILKEINRNSNLKLQLIVAGAHLSHEFGYTLKEIQHDKFKISAKVDMLLSDDSGARMSRSIGVGVLEFSQVFEMLKPDFTLLLGDREEMFSAAIASLCQNIPLAHIHGGDVGTGGHIDESIRHSLTKFAHLHFAATKKSAERVIKLGEESWRVYHTGAPFIDNLRQATPINILAKKYNLNLSKPLIVVIQHPVAIDSANSKEHMLETMRAIVSIGQETIVLYPNADAGGQAIIEAINEFKNYPFIKIFKTLPPNDYLGLLNVASVLVGNSSSAIVEAPAFHLPAVNIGSRQEGREMAENVLNVRHEAKAIQKAINTALTNKQFRQRVKNCHNPYGSKGVSKKIVSVLSKVNIDQKLLQKKLTF